MRTLQMAIVVSVAAVSATAAEVRQVSQRGKEFRPEAIEMTTGDTLRIMNDDTFLHHVYVKHPNMNFDSGGRRPGEPVDLRFAKPGTYEVECEIHPKMKLTVEVK
jgi:cytochrome c peroxidase